MYADDLVVVGVINRVRDLRALVEFGWYRIPYQRLPRGWSGEYLALFISRRVGGDHAGMIAYYGRPTGVELARRRDLLPDETAHPRADHWYYRIAIPDLQTKTPPIRGTDGMIVSFIVTTWDRFQSAATVRDLYRRDPDLTRRSPLVRGVIGWWRRDPHD